MRYEAIIKRHEVVILRYEAVIYDAGLGVFLVHPPMASVLLSASVERCFVSRMRDFSM